MQNITLYNSETDKTYDLLVSNEDAEKATTDVAFATALLNSAIKETESEQSENLLQTSLSPNEEEEPESVYRWSHSCVLMLLTTYQEHLQKFADGKYSQKKCWELIATKLKNENHNVTAAQCASKLRSLKKTYKSVKDHNSKSGNDRRTWQYFEIMDDIFSKNAWAEPVAVASSSGISKKRVNTESDSGTETNNDCRKKMSYSSSTVTSLFQKRIDQKEEHERSKNKRHEERLEMDKKLLDVLAQFLEK